MHAWDCRCGTRNAAAARHCTRCGTLFLRGRAVGGPMPAARYQPPPDMPDGPRPFDALGGLDPSARCMLRVVLGALALGGLIPCLLAGPIGWILGALVCGGFWALWTLAVMMERPATGADRPHPGPTRRA